jgi:hypothetical protein
MTYNGWMLPDVERARVLEKFHARFAVVKCSHVTLSLEDKAIPADADIEIVGYASDDGVEALVCRVSGETRRPDGGTYHLTLSVADGRASRESNDVIAKGWEPFEQPTPIQTKAFVSLGTSYVTTALSSL